MSCSKIYVYTMKHDVFSCLFLCCLFTRGHSTNSPSLDAIVRADSGFAVALFNEYAKTLTSQSNLFFSPVSISEALRVVCTIARAKTYKQMMSVLGFNTSDGKPWNIPTINSANRELISSLNDSSGDYNLVISNGLFANTNIKLPSWFVSISQKFYNANVSQLNFEGESEASRKTINNWVARQTAFKIGELLPPGSVDESTKLVLVNAIYFKAVWETPFPMKNTRERPFYIDETRSIDTDMMQVTHTFRHGNIEEFDCTALELPYKNNQVSMIILLPNVNPSSDVYTLDRAVDFMALPTLLARLPTEMVSFSMPRFQMANIMRIPKILNRMGMTDLFTANANLSGIASKDSGPLYLNNAIHKSWVEVNEGGTEAAASTGMTIDLVSMRPTFVANRPFLFAILHSTSGSVLFAGRYAAPDD